MFGAVQRNAGVDPLRKYGKRALKMIVSKWLRVNAKTMGDELTKEQSDNMFDIYNKTCDFHSPRMIRLGSSTYTMGFRICIGEATLRGSKRYKMPSMSLDFQVGRQSALLYTDIDKYLKGYINIENLHNHVKWLGLASDSSGGRQVLFNEIGIHPHVSADGNPCLGDFGQPWAVCLAQGNLPMLVSVAKSFQNNWTRNDAYWDINYVYRNWEENKFLSFKEQLCFLKLMLASTGAREETRSNYRTISEYSLTDFLKGVEYSKIRSLGMSRRQTLMYWAMANIATESKRDLEDRALSKATNLLRICKDMVETARRQIRGTLNISSGFKITGIMDAALCKVYDTAYPFNVDTHKDIFVNDAYSWVGVAYDDTRHRLRRHETSRNTRSDNRARADSILQARSDYKRQRWLVLKEAVDIKDIIYDIGEDYYEYSQTSSTAHYKRHIYVIALQRLARHCRNLRKDDFEYSSYVPAERRECLFDWQAFQQYATKQYNLHQNMTEEEWNYSEERLPYEYPSGNIGILIFGLIDTVRLNAENGLWNVPNNLRKLYAEIESDVLEDVHNQLKGKIRSVIDERNKSARIAYGSRAQSDGGENQLSLETF